MRKTILPVLATATVLAACGGGGGGGGDSPATPAAPQAAQEVPAEAYASSSAYSGFAARLGTDDRGEPLAVAKAPPPTSETDEPAEVK